MPEDSPLVLEPAPLNLSWVSNVVPYGNRRAEPLSSHCADAEPKCYTFCGNVWV
jgi:hypothetical protein